MRSFLDGIVGGPWLAARRLSSLARVWWTMRAPLGRGVIERAEALQALTHELCTNNGVVIDVTGPVPRGPCVVVANHVSYVDTLALPSLVGGTCIAKCEVARWPVIGPITGRLGILFVKRDCAFSGAVVLRQAIRALEAGVTVVAFPEGTTTAGDEPLPFKRGIFGVARRLGVPVVTAAVRYEDRALAWVGDVEFLGHYLRQVASRRQTRMWIAFSEPLDARSAASPEALATIARARIARALGQARRPPLAVGARVAAVPGV